MSNRIFTIVLIIAGASILLAHLLLHNNNNHHQLLKKDVAKNEKIATNTVEIKNYTYSPQSIKVKKGTTVTWINEDLVPHTVTKSDKNKNGPDSTYFGKGKKYSYTFGEIGRYDYYCKPHPYMKATVEVIE
jgi:plastocyanin